jgi:hypothetical protein
MLRHAAAAPQGSAENAEGCQDTATAAFPTLDYMSILVDHASVEREPRREHRKRSAEGAFGQLNLKTAAHPGQSGDSAGPWVGQLFS